MKNSQLFDVEIGGYKLVVKFADLDPKLKAMALKIDDERRDSGLSLPYHEFDGETFVKIFYKGPIPPLKKKVEKIFGYPAKELLAKQYK